MMSKLTVSGSPKLPRRRRRADAERSRSAILDAACRVLNERPQASIEDIAAAAGVTRQTVYAHFASRERLIGAVIERVTADVVAATDAAALDEGSPAAALDRLLRAWLQLMARYPFLLQDSVVPMNQQDVHASHQPIFAPLERLVRRGQDSGDFDRQLSPTWLLAATVGLGHAAGAEAGAGRLTLEDAGEAFRRSVLRVFGVTAATISDSDDSNR